MSKISVEKAVNKGQLWVNLPVFVVMMSTMGMSIYLMSISSDVFFLGGIILFILAFVLPWLTWSFLITKWRIWAFSNVSNLTKLHKEAVISKLIWERGSIFEKTEIRNSKERALIKEFERQMDSKKKSRVSLDVDEIPIILNPNEVKIFYSKSLILLEFTIKGIFPLLGGLYFISINYENWFGYLIAIFGIYKCIYHSIQLFSKEPQIILNKQGIYLEKEGFFGWYSVHSLDIQNLGKDSSLSFISERRNFHIELNYLDIDPDELERLINNYTSRK
jgi:hypothetical protein